MQKIDKAGLEDRNHKDNMVWWALLEGIPSDLSKEDEAKIFSKISEVEIVFQMNGVDLDFIQVVNHWQKQVASQVSKQAKKLMHNKFRDVIELVEDMSKAVETQINKESLK